MRKRLLAASAALVVGPMVLAAHAAATPSVAIEQIEAYENQADTDYAPVHFYDGPTITLGPGDQGGSFTYTTFEALTDTPGDHFSGHANTVGQLMYGLGTVAYPYVSNTSSPDIYCEAYDTFLNDVVNTQNSTGVAPAPAHFQNGVQVVNTSYIADYGSSSPSTPTTDTDALRRIDTMIDQDNVIFVAGAVTSTSTSAGPYYLNWSSFNCIAVSGQASGQYFSPTGGPGKQHADLYLTGEASFSTAVVSGYATALYGQAASALQTDAAHNVVNRSLLMAGAENNALSGDPFTANHLDPIYGAGNPNYNTSLAILQSGEKNLAAVTDDSVTAAASLNQEGWTYGTIPALGQKVLLFSSSDTITGLTASLNWNVSSAESDGNIDTSDAAMIFPNLTLQVVPVNAAGGGSYTLGANQSNPMLVSAAVGDNIQYLHDTTPLPVGTYAFVIGGDPSLDSTVGFSYTLAGSFASQWNNSAGSSWGSLANWTTGIPNGQGAQAIFSSFHGLTSPDAITLDSNRTVGQLLFDSPVSYTLASETSGSLIIDDTGDSSGAANPQIDVSAGSQTINAPIILANGVNITVAAGASLSIGGTLTGNGTLAMLGPGSVTFANTLSATAFAFNGGNATLTAPGSLSSGSVAINPGATLTLAASSSTGVFVRNVTVPIAIQGGTLQIAQSVSSNNRQLIALSSSLTFTGTTGAWQGTLDLANNDLDEPGALLADVIDQIAEGYNAGNWNGPAGILSSTAAADTSHMTAIGVIQNNQSGTALYTTDNTFDGIVPGESDILLKYTYYGDANLDGVVDGTDYSRIDAGYLMQLTGWFNGDFNYDGVIDGSDYTLIDNAFNSQGAAFTAEIASPDAIATNEIFNPAATTSVPESAGVMLIWLCMSALLGRRRV